MWSAFVEELAILLQPNVIRIRRFRRWSQRLLHEEVSPVLQGSTGDIESASLKQVMRACRGLPARAFISQDLCRIGWVRAPEGKLSGVEAEALVRSTSALGVPPGADHIAIQTEVMSRGILFASVEQQVLEGLMKLLEAKGTRVVSARPVLAPVVGAWLNTVVTRTARMRHLIAIGARSTCAFTAEDGELVNAARFVDAAIAGGPAARLTAVRISMNLTPDDHDVLVEQSQSEPLWKDTAGATVRASGKPARTFSDLYADI